MYIQFYPCSCIFNVQNVAFFRHYLQTTFQLCSHHDRPSKPLPFETSRHHLSSRPSENNIGFDTENPTIGKFILAGKEPAQAFRQTVPNNIRIGRVKPNHVDINYDGRWWEAAPFLEVLFLKWAWKLEMSLYDWIHKPLHEGYCKMMFESNDIKDVSIVCQQKIEWPIFFYLFPNIVCLTVSPSMFSEIMTASPKELIQLKDLTFHFDVESVSDAISVLSKYQPMCPFLETVGYTSIRASEIRYPDSDLTFPAIKHLDVNLKQKCCTPLDFTFLTATSKLFPGLKSVHITANTFCECEVWSRSIKTLKKTYKAFDALKYDFFIKVTYYEELSSESRLISEAFTFLSAKGDVTGDSRVFPGKVLIHDVAVDEDDDDEYDDVYDSDNSLFYEYEY